MITLTDISKTFKTKQGTFNALKNISLSIEENTIHGIIGPSGAGKSTLIRVINQLEKQDTGTVGVFEYTDVKKLNKESTRMYRKRVSMIFQNFNLLEQKTVFQNIGLPIILHQRLKETDITLIRELITLVGLNGYENSYPNELSGGQKQRVGIARALVSKPEILLCDEPTSALDTQTIKTVLELIKTIKEKLNLTVVIVTHDMNVIKEICEEVTVMNEGEIVESDNIDNIIFNPQSPVTSGLLGTIGLDIKQFISKKVTKENMFVLLFDKSIINQSLISRVVQIHSVNINILYANITPNNKGIMLIEINGNQSKIQSTIKELINRGVEVKHV